MEYNVSSNVKLPAISFLLPPNDQGTGGDKIFPQLADMLELVTTLSSVNAAPVKLTGMAFGRSLSVLQYRYRRITDRMQR